ncbi:hypothetical protein HPB50_013805 [Hyalomma asiaticum]|uniref:Uncharacterized protein n=1 Tax=Hyalomma asiaticum TaxID=266040 RepID=A0ACB7SH53_HYAAI|nr:hypothetical protein HPB50_013805 [Hyalomma asiaticum]
MRFLDYNCHFRSSRDLDPLSSLWSDGSKPSRITWLLPAPSPPYPSSEGNSAQLLVLGRATHVPD